MSGDGPEVLGGRYELGEAIGRGGMSTVHRALDRALGRPVAVKVIRHEGLPRHEIEHLRARFRREAASVASIPPHPNVVQIFDFGVDEEGDRDFIVMELLSGRDLKSVLRERRPEVAEGVRILVAAARGLAAGHRAGVVHRDVKPANLLLAEGEGGPTVKVLDFGIARALEGDDDDLTRTAGVPLTPAYASPEQLSGAGTPGMASDVYQLGLVAYELLAGERPFGSEERSRTGEAAHLPARGAWDGVPGALRDVVGRALAPDPEARWPDAGAFADALESSAGAADPTDDETVALPPAAAPVAPGRGHSGRRLRRGAAVAAAVLAPLVVVVLLQRGGDGAVATTPENAALEEAFLPLYSEAAEDAALP